MQATPPAAIVIPAVGIRAAVHNGVDTKTLAVGAGHYPRTGWPGSGRTVGIAGHDVTYVPKAAGGHVFNRLPLAHKGFRVTFFRGDYKYVYVITGSKVVSPSDVSVLKDTGHERLTMTTCYPPHSATYRLVVFAKLVRTVALKPISWLSFPRGVSYKAR
jgi:sortase A